MKKTTLYAALAAAIIGIPGAYAAGVVAGHEEGAGLPRGARQEIDARRRPRGR